MVHINKKRYRIVSALLSLLMMGLAADAYVTQSINAYYFPKNDYRAAYIWMGVTLLVAAVAAFEALFARLWRNC